MNFRSFLLFPLLFIFAACSNKYKPFKSNYEFKSTDGVPDYTSLNYWAAHPWKWDPSDSVPKPIRKEIKDSTVDVFFLHPTTYTGNYDANHPNASIDDDFINAKTDYSSILYQASVFNNQCRVFAPRYRQAQIKNFFIKEKEAAAKAFALAYEDVKKSFIYYMEHWNNGRPIIIAGHSQGSLMAEMLLKDFFDHSPDSTENLLQKKLVVAYIAGWPVPNNYFRYLKMCEDSLQTGCICSWRTYRIGFEPFFAKNDTLQVNVTNPISWRTNEEFISRKMNEGSVLKKFNKIYRHTTDAQISNGFLYTRKPTFPWSFLYFSKNYHVGDINLYYMNIRENVKQRITSFFNK